ncbi:MAG: hypothetical protein LC623_03500 [Halobacteriales archaeon]|nr:hypothetical protein [Halobacteriales archaeon]
MADNASRPSGPPFLLRKKMSSYYKRWRRGRLFWSFAHHGSLFGSVFLSALVAVVATLPQGKFWGLSSTVWMSMVSVAAGFLTTIAGLGGFKSKWKMNRQSVIALDSLLLEMEEGTGKTGIEEFSKRFRELVKVHEGGIEAAEDVAPHASVVPGQQPA